MTLGDHLRPLGVRTALCGKTHMRADLDGMKRCGVDPASPEGQRMAECGFEVWDRLDGLHPSAHPKGPSHYQDYLRSKGYDCDNPWEDYVNAPTGDQGEPLSPWEMQFANRPARVAEQHRETAYSTDRAIEFIEHAGDQPWCLHLSYIKPHWPYVAPAPYHNMYSGTDVLPVVRADEERDEGHPLLQAYQQGRVSQVFTKPGLRERVIPTYMGLIKQIDDHVGRLVAHLKDNDLDQNTLIVFTSDHSDDLSDHWMGEKDFFHECSVKTPLIVVDPSREADATRGTDCDALVESIDLVPTFVEYFDGDVQDNIIEGKSLRGLLHGTTEKLRDYVISEYDYAAGQARAKLGKSISDRRVINVEHRQGKALFQAMAIAARRGHADDLTVLPNRLKPSRVDP